MDGSFVIVGNIAGKLAEFEKLVPDLLKYSPQLMLVTGNITEDGTDESYRKSYAALSQVYKRYGVAIEVTPGSKDRYNDKLPDTYSAYFGEPTATFTALGTRFITLDSSSGVLGNKQLEFLEKNLTTNSFIFTHYPPSVGLWAFESMKEGSPRFLSILAERAHLVKGCFFGGIKTLHQEKLASEGMMLNVPAWVVGNGGEAFEISKFGYSRPGKCGGLAVMVRSGQVSFEAITAAE
jgi:hypothetical protein